MKIDWELMWPEVKFVGAGESQKSLCNEYAVSPMTISRVVRNQTWRGLK